MRYSFIAMILVLSGQVLYAGDAPPPPVAEIELGSITFSRAKTDVKKLIEECNSRAQLAGQLCLDANPEIKAATAAAGGMLALSNMANGQADACKKGSDMLDMLSKALTAFNTMCGGAQLACNISCGNLKAKTAELSSREMQVPSDGVEYGKDLAKLKNLTTQVEATYSVCDSYKYNLAAAAVGLTNVLTQKKKGADECRRQVTTNDKCIKNPQDPSCPQSLGALDCSKGENASKLDCICLVSPKTQGCPAGANSYASNPNMGSPNSGLGGSAGTPAGRGVIGAPATGEKMAARPQAPGGSDGAGKYGTVQGARGADGSAISSSQAKKAVAASKRQGFETAILEEAEGGGGGGYRGASSGSDYDNSQYKNYIPNGKNDPTRAVASQQAIRQQISTEAGFSNWEKVRTRYNENLSSFLSY